MEDSEAGGEGFLSYIIPYLLRIGTVVTGLLAIAAGVLYVKQDKLLYFPEIGGIPRRPADNPRGYRSPEERQLPFESHMIPCADGVHIHAWFLQAPNSAKAPTVVFFHGNAGNIGLRLPNAMQMVQFLGANVLMVEYRGYGNSDSVDPNEAGLKLDAEAALQFAQQHNGIDSSKVFLFGRSLGGSVAFHVADYAVKHNIAVAGCVVENTYTSISAMVDQLMPFLTPLKFLVLRIGWDSTRIVTRLSTVPLLFLAGARDELVPHNHMQELYQAAKAAGGGKNLVQMHIIPDGTHNESWLQGGPMYWDTFRSFMEAALQQQQQQGSVVSSRIDSKVTSGTAGLGNDVRSSIPIMSSRFVDNIKEVVGAGGSGGANSAVPKKEL